MRHPFETGVCPQGDVPCCGIGSYQSPDMCARFGSSTERPSLNKGSILDRAEGTQPRMRGLQGGWRSYLSGSRAGAEAGNVKGTLCWAGIAQFVDPTGHFSPLDLGAVSGLAERLSMNSELLLSACRSTSMLTCCHQPTHLHWGAGWGTVSSCQ